MSAERDFLSDKRIQVTSTDEANGPGTLGMRLSHSVWIRFPGGPWVATSEMSQKKVRDHLAGIGLESVVVNRDIDLLDPAPPAEVRGSEEKRS